MLRYEYDEDVEQCHSRASQPFASQLSILFDVVGPGLCQGLRGDSQGGALRQVARALGGLRLGTSHPN